MNSAKTTIGLPVIVLEEDGHWIITTTPESEKITCNAVCASGKTFPDAEKRFWEMFNIIAKYNEKRSRELDKYKFFQKGDWKHIGGKWFTIIGFHFYLRYGKNMKGGKYIPFTKLNILFLNYWVN